MRWTDIKVWRLLFVMLFLVAYTVGAKSPLLSKKRWQEIEKKYGSFGVKRIDTGLNLIKRIETFSEKRKLDEVNRYVNYTRFVSDKVAWGKKDYWAKPVEFLGGNKGDCEDFVITKYFMLRKSGVSEEKLFFTYVKAIRINQSHMVLTYYETPKSIPLVLDNLNSKILPASKRNDLAFVYSFNAKKLYLNKKRGLGKVVPDGRNKNRKWSNFLENFEKDF